MDLTKEMFRNPALVRAIDVLSNKGWLSERTEEVRSLIFSIAELRQFRTDEAIYHIGDQPNGLFGLVEGSLQISIATDYGEEYAPHRADIGYWIGDLALFSGGSRIAGVKALAPTLLLFVPRPKILSLVKEYPELYRDFYALSESNMSLALRLLANLAVTRSDIRLALRLLLYEELSSEPRGWLPISQGQLAAMIAVSVPTLQRVLKDFANDGLVEVGYSKLRIIDREKLLALCQN